MEDRRRMVGWLALCLILTAFALLQTFAIRGLQKENSRLRDDLTKSIADQVAADQQALQLLAAAISEHRSEETARDYKMTQTVQLEATRTRDYLKEICRP